MDTAGSGGNPPSPRESMMIQTRKKASHWSFDESNPDAKRAMSAFRSKPRGAESGQMPRQAPGKAAGALEAALSSIDCRAPFRG